MVHAFIARWAVLPRAKAALEALLIDPVEAVRMEAATVLLQPDGNHQAALQTLKSLFTSTNASTRQWAAARYLNMGSSAGRLEDEMVPIFISTLSGSDKDQLKSACHCLGRFGPRAKAAVPALSKHLQSTDPELQKAAWESLERIAPEVLPAKKP
jgi:HEAT repeat protein